MNPFEKFFYKNPVLICCPDSLSAAEYVRKQIQSIHKNSDQICIVATSQAYDQGPFDHISRDSSLNPFIQSDISTFLEPEFLPYLEDFFHSLLSFAGPVPDSLRLKERIDEVIKKNEGTSEPISLWDFFEDIRPGFSELTNELSAFCRTVDCTVESIINEKDFYMECSEPAVLYFNLVQLLIKCKKVSRPIRIFTDIFNCISENPAAVLFLTRILSDYSDQVAVTAISYPGADLNKFILTKKGKNRPVRIKKVRLKNTKAKREA